MSRPIVPDDGVWLRAMRLLAVVVLLGGIGAGPLVHVAVESHRSGPVASQADRPEDPGSPDAHHLCPVCLTLSSAVPAVVPTGPGASLADTPALTSAGAAMHGRTATDLTRARAPPVA